jgi:hypothetical protein
MFQLQLFFLHHCDEWDRVVALPRHKFVTGATLLQLSFSELSFLIAPSVFSNVYLSTNILFSIGIWNFSDSMVYFICFGR